MGMKIVEKRIDELVPAEYNPRQLSEEQYKDLRASMEEFGEVEPILVNIHPDRENVIVGGHQRVRVAKDMGWKTIEAVEVSLPLERERQLNIRLNKNTGSWDWDALANWFDAEELQEWGFSEEELFGEVLDEESEQDDIEKYTNKIESPAYEANKISPPLVAELVETVKADELVMSIEKSEITKEEKRFLKMAAARHYRFDYEKIAEFYCHADAEMQELMEQSGLVIVDAKSAISHGFMRLTKKIAEQYEDELDND